MASLRLWREQADSRATLICRGNSISSGYGFGRYTVKHCRIIDTDGAGS